MKVNFKHRIYFEEVYIAYYSRMNRFAKSYLVSEEDAENIVQDIFIEILEKKIDLCSISNIGGYLFLLLKNKCIDHLRRKRTETLALTEIQKEYEIRLKHDSLEALDNNILTDPNIEILIEHAINKLPEKCKQIFVMNKFHGKKQKIIAEELNVSIKTVENQMSIAYKKLKEELKAYFSITILLF